jgi:hypothetical protein
MRIVSGTFSVSDRPVGQVIFVRRLARTYAVSGKSPTHSASTAGGEILGFGFLGRLTGYSEAIRLCLQTPGFRQPRFSVADNRALHALKTVG